MAMEWISMHVATDVIFVSPSLAVEALNRGLPPRRKTWIIGDGSSNGVDTKAIAQRISVVKRSQARSFNNLNEAHFVVGFIGRITRDKGIGTVLDAFNNPRLTSRARLLLIGDEEEPGWSIKVDKLQDRVRRVGWTDDVWGYFPAMDILVLPTRREGFPNVVLEAASASVPSIVTTATGAIDSVIDGNTGWLIHVDDSQAIVEFINHLAENPEIVQRTGLNAKRRAQEAFKPERIWAGLLEVLDAVPTPEVAESLYPARGGGSP